MYGNPQIAPERQGASEPLRNWELDLGDIELLRTVMEKTMQNLIGSNCNHIFEFYFTHGDYEL